MTYEYALMEDSHTATIDSDGKPLLTFKRKYLLASDSGSNIGTFAARLGFQTLSTIVPGQSFVDYPAATCRTVVVDRLHNRPPHQMWTVDCEWSTETKLIDDPNPVNRRYVRKVSTSDQQRYVFRDRNGKLIQDSAGSPFDGGVPVNVRLATVVWDHNVDFETYDIGRVTQLSGKLNSDVFMGCDPKTLMIDVIGDEQWEGIYHYVKELITITYDPLGWQPKPANAGLFQLDYATSSSTPERKRIQVDSKDVQEPEPLYGASSSTPGKLIPIANRPQDCNFIEVDYYDTFPFGSLNLPLN